MKKYIAFVSILIFVGCKCPFARIVELGNHFALVQVDDTDILYNQNGEDNCYFSSETAIVVPCEVTAYNFDNHWIIAERLTNNEKSYYIINKDYVFTRLGYPEELKKQTIGPLNITDFKRKLHEYNIKLELKSTQ